MDEKFKQAGGKGSGVRRRRRAASGNPQGEQEVREEE